MSPSDWQPGIVHDVGPSGGDMEWLTDAALHGKYLVQRKLGEGGMGGVCLAEHVSIGRTVALKSVRPDPLQDPTAAERVVREARAAGGIQHRHVVNVTDFGVDRVHGSDVAYLVMEHLHGETLESVLESQSRRPVSQVVDIIEQVAAALGAAHARGVVHRDLKRRDAAPSDTASSVGVHASDAAAAASTTTQVGESIGTPAYMSPDQCVGDDVDQRSDLYSLGVVVYQMLAGVLPFRGDTRARPRKEAVGLLSVSLVRATPIIGLAGGLTFIFALFFQLFIALVDVMLYDLAYDMTEA